MEHPFFSGFLEMEYKLFLHKSAFTTLDRLHLQSVSPVYVLYYNLGTVNI